MNRKGKSRTLATAPAAGETPGSGGQQNNVLHNMSCAPTSRIQHLSEYRRPGSRGIVFALASGENAIAALSKDLRTDRGSAARSDDLHRSLRRLIDTHARTLPFPAAAIVTDKAEPIDEKCSDLLTIATVLAKSSGHVYLRDKVPNLGQITPGRRVVLIVPAERRMR